MLFRSQVKHADIVLVALGKLTKLAILRLHNEPFEKGELHIHYQPEAFARLTFLQLVNLSGLKSVKFEEKATPKLELLQVHNYFVRVPRDTFFPKSQGSFNNGDKGGLSEILRKRCGI